MELYDIFFKYECYTEDSNKIIIFNTTLLQDIDCVTSKENIQSKCPNFKLLKNQYNNLIITIEKKNLLFNISLPDNFDGNRELYGKFILYKNKLYSKWNIQNVMTNRSYTNINIYKIIKSKKINFILICTISLLLKTINKHSSS